MADSEIDLMFLFAIQNLWKAINCLEAKVSDLQNELNELKKECD
jgi:hypothetical protein